ncbi:hypothetical protein DOTSEDRAFT_26109 [Dothistroma septosporum NZE10]|uniref:Uncharacterized protein n=1 Tax=Dothistroma septosporum (strain NZE10 / CBS 128990) TaxID=675120 RepID=N1PK83_DOTSN|nr:hypothetical protein DOTSEDRAFT_26109 [Dothistroma septosporum NZE10]
MARRVTFARVLVLLAAVVHGQQQCYFGPGAENRGPDNLIPCMSTGSSACCLQGDTCLSGNACFNYPSGNVYQYGCTDISYSDETCPYKCGFNTTKSPWTALEYCNDVQGASDNWICHGPESCGCEWPFSEGMLELDPRGCRAMGSDALVALYAPSQLAPYISLPVTAGGSTGYYSPTVSSGSSTWVVTAIPGYTPLVISQLTTYREPPTTRRQVAPGVTPDSSTYASALTWTDTRPGSLSATISSSATFSLSATPTTFPSLAASTSHSSTLSTGSKVGIGVGVAGGVCLIASLLLIVVLMHRRHKKQAQSVLSPPPPQWPQSPYMQQAPRYPAYPPYQAPEGETPVSPKPSVSAGPNAPPSELAGEARLMTHEM